MKSRSAARERCSIRPRRLPRIGRLSRSAPKSASFAPSRAVLPDRLDLARRESRSARCAGRWRGSRSCRRRRPGSRSSTSAGFALPGGPAGCWIPAAMAALASCSWRMSAWVRCTGPPSSSVRRPFGQPAAGLHPAQLQARRHGIHQAAAADPPGHLVPQIRGSARHRPPRPPGRWRRWWPACPSGCRRPRRPAPPRWKRTACARHCPTRSRRWFPGPPGP